MTDFKGVYHGCYVIDDAPEREDIHVGIGFEFDADYGHIQWMTREGARQLFVGLAKSFPFGEARTESHCTVTGTEREP